MVSCCTRSMRGRTIYRWEDEWMLEETRACVLSEKDKAKRRNLLVEHIFGTMKQAMNQGYMLLLRGREKVAGEMSLTVFAYNEKRVLNIIGLKRLKEVVLMMGKFKEARSGSPKMISLYIFRFWMSYFHKLWKFGRKSGK